MKVSVLVGNPKSDSRTLKLANAMADRFTRPGDIRFAIDLAEHVDSIFDWPSVEMDDLSNRVASSDVLIVASPTYKATYTGLLKSFLDRYGKNGLEGVLAIPVMTGADATHSLAPEIGLRHLLVELGACVPTRALYFSMPNMDRLDEILDTWMTENQNILKFARSWRNEVAQ
jgi:FMN reductase